MENPSNQPERTNEAAAAYAKACVAVAGECGLSVIDLWTKIQQLPDWEKSCLRSFSFVYLLFLVFLYCGLSHSTFYLLEFH